jgi:hypothetical protein
VTYEWVDRQSGQTIHQKVTGQEFLRRFLQHTLPKGLVRVRHYGFLSAAGKERLATVRESLGISPVISAEVPPPDSLPLPSVAAMPSGGSGEPIPTRRACCAGCQKEMTFKEFRTAREVADPPELRPEKEVNQPEDRALRGQKSRWHAAPLPARGPPLIYVKPPRSGTEPCATVVPIIP